MNIWFFSLLGNFQRLVFKESIINISNGKLLNLFSCTNSVLWNPWNRILNDHIIVHIDIRNVFFLNITEKAYVFEDSYRLRLNRKLIFVMILRNEYFFNLHHVFDIWNMTDLRKMLDHISIEILWDTNCLGIVKKIELIVDLKLSW